MSCYVKCERCKEYRFITACKKCECKPFTITCEDDEEEYLRYGDCPQDVALKFAEESNQDCELMNESIEIIVDGAKFTISAEPDIHYSAIQHK